MDSQCTKHKSELLDWLREEWEPEALNTWVFYLSTLGAGEGSFPTQRSTGEEHTLFFKYEFYGYQLIFVEAGCGICMSALISFPYFCVCLKLSIIKS